eukprot:COSAG02_NODE_477_length_21523_cov_11.763163_9_plen_168_part_00
MILPMPRQLRAQQMRVLRSKSCRVLRFLLCRRPQLAPSVILPLLLPHPQWETTVSGNSREVEPLWTQPRQIVLQQEVAALALGTRQAGQATILPPRWWQPVTPACEVRPILVEHHHSTVRLVLTAVGSCSLQLAVLARRARPATTKSISLPAIIRRSASNRHSHPNG